MKKSIFINLALFALVLLPSAAFSADDDKKPQGSAGEVTYTSALLDLQSSEKNLSDITPKINALLSAYLSAYPQLSLVERAEIDKALGEQELGTSGTVDPQTAAKIGYLTGAKILISGRVFSVDNQLFLVAKIIGTETGRVYGETESTTISDTPAPAVQKLAEKISKTIAERGPSMIAPEEKKEDLIALLKKAVDGKKLPSISVEIAERTVGSATLAMAAETELTSILQQLGFEALDRKTSAKLPDIEIKGEAFSQFGMKRGNFSSSKGRVELKAIDRVSGRILAADRQTEVAVDLSEEIAGKSALEKATTAVAKRVVPKLVQ